MNSNNPDDPLPFIALSALVANVVSYLEGARKKKEQGNRDTGSGNADEEAASRKREYVNQRLGELIPPERRARIEG